MSNFQIWITIENDEPTFTDFSLARAKLWELGIGEHHNIGIMLNMTQWTNLKILLEKFDPSAKFKEPKEIMGFPVKLVREL